MWPEQAATTPHPAFFPGNKALGILVPGTTTSYCLETVVQAQQLPQEPDPCSLWEACQRLALHRVLLLWRTRLYQHQQAV